MISQENGQIASVAKVEKTELNALELKLTAHFIFFIVLTLTYLVSEIIYSVLTFRFQSLHSLVFQYLRLMTEPLVISFLMINLTKAVRGKWKWMGFDKPPSMIVIIVSILIISHPIDILFNEGHLIIAWRFYEYLKQGSLSGTLFSILIYVIASRTISRMLIIVPAETITTRFEFYVKSNIQGFFNLLALSFFVIYLNVSLSLDAPSFLVISIPVKILLLISACYMLMPIK